MTIKEQLNSLTNSDIYSLMMFVLFKLNDVNEYSSLSQLSYILSQEDLLKLCEYYGGTTIRIPTIKELETVLDALLLYQYVNIEHKDFETELVSFDVRLEQRKKIIACYEVICELLKDYNFKSGR